MFPFVNSYNPYSNHSSPYMMGQPDFEYSRALAEEQAARRQYAAALRAQEDARRRAAQARLARQAYAPAYNSYLDDEEDDPFEYHPNVNPYGAISGSYGYSPRDRYLAQQRALAEEKRRIELLRAQQQRERELLEREYQRRLQEEERRRMALLEEEKRRREQQRQSNRQSMYDPLEELFGYRPNPRFSEEANNVRRARTQSPAQRTYIPVHTSRSPSPRAREMSQPSPVQSYPTTASQNAGSSPPSPKTQPTKVEFTPEQISAAEKILGFYRQHHPRISSLKQISNIRNEFEQLRAGFKLPESLDYLVNSEPHNIISIPTAGEMNTDVANSEEPVPKLAYTSNNSPVHKYDDTLQRLLTKLDAIESHGDALVRQKRRTVVGIIERENEWVNGVGRRVWTAWKQHKDDQKGMDVDEVKGGEAEAQSDPQHANTEHIVTPPSLVTFDDSNVQLTSTISESPEIPMDEDDKNHHDIHETSMPVIHDEHAVVAEQTTPRIPDTVLATNDISSHSGLSEDLLESMVVDPNDHQPEAEPSPSVSVEPTFEPLATGISSTSDVPALDSSESESSEETVSDGEPSTPIHTPDSSLLAAHKPMSSGVEDYKRKDEHQGEESTLHVLGEDWDDVADLL